VTNVVINFYTTFEFKRLLQQDNPLLHESKSKTRFHPNPRPATHVFQNFLSPAIPKFSQRSKEIVLFLDELNLNEWQRVPEIHRGIGILVHHQQQLPDHERDGDRLSFIRPLLEKVPDPFAIVRV
jgi:hypothetical protein